MQTADREIAAGGGERQRAQLWLERNAALVALAAAVLAAAALLLALSAGLTYYQDTWAFLMHRRAFTADAFLEPHNEHIVLIPVVIVKLLLFVFGMTSALPEFVVFNILLATTAVLLFVYVRRRLGPWPAVIAAVLLLFVGPAWEVLLWPFEVGFVGAIMSGIAMLLALEREERRWDVAACALLTISLGFSTLGTSFVVAAIVVVFQSRKTIGLRRAYVVAIPALLFLAWYAGWGHTAESHLSLHNVLASPRFLFEGLASSIDSVLGLSTIGIDGLGEPVWGRPLLIAALVLIGYRQVRKPGFSPQLWPAAAAAASFWLLAAFNYIPSREPVSSRYTYAGAAFLLLMAADLLQGVRFSRTALWLGGAIVVVAVGSNLIPLNDGRHFLMEQTVLTRADVGAIDIARRTVPPSFALTPEIAGTPSLIDVNAAEYLPAVREYGSPGYSPDELANAPEAGRRQADVVLSRALSLSAAIDPHAALSAAGRCVDVAAGSGPTSEVRLFIGVNRIGLAPGPDASYSMRRFAEGEFPVSMESAPGDSVTTIRIPRDAAPQPWYLHVEATQPVRVCH
jgi:hypothetical protein